MASRRRCTECRRTFTPSPRALATQCVCGPACRAARDRKLARARRRREIDDYRADECDRQRASRAGRARSATTVGVPPGCHAPPSASKSPDLRKEIAQIVERIVARSRATLEHDLRRIWPRQREIVARPGAASRASFGAQACDSEGQSGAIPACCHT